MNNPISKYVTSTDSNVFCLKNLPEVVKGALFSRYSRSEKGLRKLLLDEFINAPEAHLTGLSGDEDELVNLQKAEEFYSRVLDGYGDDSIAELGGAHIACEGISNIAAKALEDSRIGISPLEKSTRYVRFDQRVNGKYLYYREPSIMESEYAELYEQTLDNLFNTYSALINHLIDYLKTQYPQDNATTDRAYNTAIKAKSLDILRGLLPMATLTNVGLYGNGRAFEYLLVKLRASSLDETVELSDLMFTELSKVIPSFVKKFRSNRSMEQSRSIEYRTNDSIDLAEMGLCSNWVTGENKLVKLIEYDGSAVDKILAAILYPHSHLSLSNIRDQLTDFTKSDKELVLKTYLGDRRSRFDKVGRAFEEIYYTFDILADIGAYRDLQRHRVLSQEHQNYTTQHGYDVPRELIESGLDSQYKDALNKADEAFREAYKNYPIAAQYMVPFAYKIRWKIKVNLRESYHFIELRSGRQGHPSYRKIAQEMYLAIKAKHPLLVEGMLVDMNDHDLERIEAEKKKDLKNVKN